MKAFSEVRGKEVLSNDGRTMGKVDDFTYEPDHTIKSMITKMNKDVVEDVGEDKPLISSLKLGIGVEQIKALSDKVVLHEPISELYKHFLEVFEDEKISSLVGMKITGSQGRNIGKVKDVIMDTDTWGVPNLLVTINPEVMDILDVEKPILSKTKLEISMNHVGSIGDMIMLDTSAEEMNRVIKEVPIKRS